MILKTSFANLNAQFFYWLVFLIGFETPESFSQCLVEFASGGAPTKRSIGKFNGWDVTSELNPPFVSDSLFSVTPFFFYNLSYFSPSRNANPTIYRYQNEGRTDPVRRRRRRWHSPI